MQAATRKAIYLQSQYSQQAVRSQLIGGIANTYFTPADARLSGEITTETVAIYKKKMYARWKQ